MGPLDVEEALLDRYPVVKMMAAFGTCISSQKAHLFPSVVPCARVRPPHALAAPRRCGALRPRKALDDFQWNTRQHRLLGRYAAIVVASRYMQDEHVRHGVSRESVISAPLFPTIETPGCTSGNSTEPTVLFAGRMTELKGPVSRSTPSPRRAGFSGVRSSW